MADLRLPRLVGTRAAARELADDQDIPNDLTGEAVVIYGRNLVSGSQSFADELVDLLLEKRRADRLELVACPDDFYAYMEHAAELRGMQHKITTRHPVAI